jgi:16S rRNA (guanine527-N7)-methyltransferase
VKLEETGAYSAHGLDAEALDRLSALGDLIQGAGFNITSISDPQEIERVHFLDSLSLLEVPGVRRAKHIADLGSGAGMPALVLAIALPAQIIAVESQQKKCAFIQRAVDTLTLETVTVCCARAEDYGRGEGRAAHDLVVSRAVAALPVVLEYSMPLLSPAGIMVAMKGSISDQELIQAGKALGILGGDSLEAVKLQPFPDAQNRWAYVARKIRPTPPSYPRRPGMPAKKPLGT